MNMRERGKDDEAEEEEGSGVPPLPPSTAPPVNSPPKHWENPVHYQHQEPDKNHHYHHPQHPLSTHRLNTGRTLYTTSTRNLTKTTPTTIHSTPCQLTA